VIIRAGTKVVCSQGHVCGEVTSDIDTDQRIVGRDGDRPPFELAVSSGSCVPDHGSQEWRCAACDEVVARVSAGPTWRIHTERGWIG
jgi:hypothetical protein